MAIGKELLTLNCEPHSVTRFIVITLLLININNTVTIRRGMLDVHGRSASLELWELSTQLS